MNPEGNKDRGPVLQLITGLAVGGAERVVLELSGSLIKLGCPVIVVALNSDGRLLAQYSNAPFPIHFLGARKTNPWAVIKAFSKLVELVRTERVAVIHAHMFHALLAGLICRLARPKVRLVFTSHSFAGFSLMRRWLIKRTKSFRAADIVFVKDQHKGLNAVHTLVIPNGVVVTPDADLLQRPRTDKHVFLFVGRLEKPKNPLALIDAFAAMKNRRCELWMAGDGTLRNEVEQRIEHFGLRSRITMLGIRNDIPTLLRQVDCFVMSSSWEGLPMALLEAGAAALPVIATPVGAVRDILGADCGYLTNLDNLAKTLDAVADDYAAAKARGVRLRERIAAMYSRDQVAERHHILYKLLVQSEQVQDCN
jgi:glycosyltransferase involved in cell wall biosynthesis